MLIEKVRKLSVQERWLYWIKERESIRLKRKAGKQKPWTDDEILQSYRFCNVRRMDDKVSQWLLNNWYIPNYDHPHIVRVCALARFINLPSSLEKITTLVFDGDWKSRHRNRIVKELLNHKKGGNNVFNAAYIVTGMAGVDKIETVVDRFVSTVPSMVNTDTQEQCHADLSRCLGFGSFMSGQVTADLRHAKSGQWSDSKTWAPIGPGSRRGMNRYLGFPKNNKLGQLEFLTNLKVASRTLKTQLPKIYKRLEAIDVQNTFCEFDKYERTLHNAGKPKRKYQGK